MSIEMTTLPNGLRIITDAVPAVESVAIGVWAGVGARHETLAEGGVSHMVEHMMFKGTPTRSATQIVEQIEDAGGHVNAYTSREVTAYHIHLLKDDWKLALDVLADIIQNPTMPDMEIERERGVILQEIGMTLDTPDDLVFDVYQETAYPGQALGAPILGRPETIIKMPRDTLMKYVEYFYTPARLVISAAGNLRHNDIVAQVEKLFTDLPVNTDNVAAPADYHGGEIRIDKVLEQSHIILGFEGISRQDDDFFAAAALATIMGGGMSSRLFQEIRERRGLVYTVFSFHHAYQDSGQFAVYAGTGPEKLPELIPVLCDEIGKITNNLAPQELARAQAQIKSSIVMGRESMLSRAGQQAKHLIHHGRVPDIQDRLARVDALRVDDVKRAARRIFTSARPTLAALGPLSQLEDYDTLAARLAA